MLLCFEFSFAFFSSSCSFLHKNSSYLWGISLSGIQNYGACTRNMPTRRYIYSQMFKKQKKMKMIILFVLVMRTRSKVHLIKREGRTLRACHRFPTINRSGVSENPGIDFSLRSSAQEEGWCRLGSLYSI